ncbi:MAG: tRNA (adenosine(37)-N6)-dimethylallyltransferase MiaA [Dehalococcoidia bacterium]|nr:tRNA (adenosine(37)-N6)-dimethylallyltransferase MiaA [Dehalococcoidia bacterium]
MTAPSRRHLVALVGATASGKTEAAVEVARRLPVEVISADSRQVRAGMRVGTAAPTDEELAAVPHHLVGVVEPDAPWSLAEFLARARAALEDIWSRGKLPLVVGGTGQYVWALLEGWQPPAVPPDPALRARLEEAAARCGPAPLIEELRALDPDALARVDARNPRRLIRAIEVARAGVSAPTVTPRDFTGQVVGLHRDREVLHARADARAERMVATGLLEETRGLLERYPADLPAFQSIGYAEAIRVLRGEWDLATAVARMKIETHRLIRMQATWFRADDPRIRWVDSDRSEDVVRAVEEAAAARVG